jgi:hemolysin III
MDNSGNLINLEHDNTLESLELNIQESYSDLPTRSDREEQLNTWSHGIFAGASVIAFWYIIIASLNSPKEYAFLSAFIYGASLIILFGASAFYHNATTPVIKKRLRILDHCAIFLFIAGNYTPLLLLTIGGSTGWSLMLLQWTVAAIGILLKIRFTGKYDWFFVVLYVLMAWVGVVQGDYLIECLPATAFYLLLVGGMVYMIGIIFYKAEGLLPYAHFIWHLFVMGGCFLHFIVMVLFVF